MARGIMQTIGLAATLIFAIPVALMGVDWVLAGKPLGFGFIGLAVLMIVVEEYVINPADIPAKILERSAGALVREPSDEVVVEDSGEN